MLLMIEGQKMSPSKMCYAIRHSYRYVMYMLVSSTENLFQCSYKWDWYVIPLNFFVFQSIFKNNLAPFGIGHSNVGHLRIQKMLQEKLYKNFGIPPMRDFLKSLLFIRWLIFSNFLNRCVKVATEYAIKITDLVNCNPRRTHHINEFSNFGYGRS